MNNYMKKHVKTYDIAWQVIHVSFLYATFAFSSPAYTVSFYGQVFSRFSSSFDMGFAFGIKDSIPNLNTFSSVPFRPHHRLLFLVSVCARETADYVLLKIFFLHIYVCVSRLKFAEKLINYLFSWKCAQIFPSYVKLDIARLKKEKTFTRALVWTAQSSKLTLIYKTEVDGKKYRKLKVSVCRNGKENF